MKSLYKDNKLHLIRLELEYYEKSSFCRVGIVH